MISTRSPRGARALGMLVLAVAFAAGAIAATTVGRVLYADPPAATTEPDGESCDRKHGNLLDRLDLSSVQRQEIDGILDRRREQTDRFWSDAGPTLNAIMDSTRAEIRAVLTPAQRDEYDRLRRERKAAEKAEREAREERESSGAGR